MIVLWDLFWTPQKMTYKKYLIHGKHLMNVNFFIIIIIIILVFLPFLEPLLWHMEVPRLGV